MTTSERVPMWQAASMLGVSHAKIWQLVKDEQLVAEMNPLDRREKLIRVSDVERLKAQGFNEERPWPRTIGAADLGIQSDEVDDWLETSWRPC